MRTVVIHNCTVEIRVPDLIEMSGTTGPREQPRVNLVCYEHLHDVLVKMPDGKVVTIKKLFMREMRGVMMPGFDEVGNVVLFTVADAVLADPPAIGHVYVKPDITVESK